MNLALVYQARFLEWCLGGNPLHMDGDRLPCRVVGLSGQLPQGIILRLNPIEVQAALTYEERLWKLGVPTTRFCRPCSDMIEVYKMFPEYDLRHNSADIYTRAQLLYFRTPQDYRSVSMLLPFRHRVVNTWNS